MRRLSSLTSGLAGPSLTQTTCSFPAILDACEQLCELADIPTKNLYLWVDYTSIPQANPYLKKLSINSLGIYSSVCRYFICLAGARRGASRLKTRNQRRYILGPRLVQVGAVGTDDLGVRNG